MSHAPTSRIAAGRERSSARTYTDGEAETLLSALEDDGCRAIIEATSEAARSANELSERLEMPLSTLYRKLDRLTETGLLAEQIRIRPSGQHVSEYARVVADIAIDVDSEGRMKIEVAQRDGGDEEASVGTRRDR